VADSLSRRHRRPRPGRRPAAAHHARLRDARHDLALGAQLALLLAEAGSTFDALAAMLDG
jgi:hypothetical protein